MDEQRYEVLANDALRRIEALLENVDAEDVDWERAGDVLTLTFRSKQRAVVNTQRPTRQIWVAANARAWHYDWDEGGMHWVDSKTGAELFEQLKGTIFELAGVRL